LFGIYFSDLSAVSLQSENLNETTQTKSKRWEEWLTNPAEVCNQKGEKGK
jgi:hypothetical protein